MLAYHLQIRIDVRRENIKSEQSLLCHHNHHKYILSTESRSARLVLFAEVSSHYFLQTWLMAPSHFTCYQTISLWMDLTLPSPITHQTYLFFCTLSHFESSWPKSAERQRQPPLPLQRFRLVIPGSTPLCLIFSSLSTI